MSVGATREYWVALFVFGGVMPAATAYYIFTSLHALALGATVTLYVPFLLSIGLSLAEVSLVNTVFWSMVIASELPTGMFADGHGRSFSLACGSVAWGMGSLLYFCAESFAGAACAEAMLAVGIAFYSGADQAWVTDALIAEGRLLNLRRVFGTASVIRGVGMVIGGFLGTCIGTVGLAWIWLPGMILAIANTLFVVLFMRERGEAAERVSEREALLKSWKLLCASRDLLWVLGALLAFGLVIPFNHYWSVFFTERVGQDQLGWVWVTIYVSLIAAGMWVRRQPPGRHEGAFVALSLIACGGGLAAAGLFSGFVLPMAAVIVHEAGRGAFQPLVEAFVHHRVESSHRATYASLQSFLGKAGFVVVPLVVWGGLTVAGEGPGTIPVVWLMAGTLLCVFALLLWMTQPRSETPKA